MYFYIFLKSITYIVHTVLIWQVLPRCECHFGMRHRMAVCSCNNTHRIRTIVHSRIHPFLLRQWDSMQQANSFVCHCDLVCSYQCKNVNKFFFKVIPVAIAVVSFPKISRAYSLVWLIRFENFWWGQKYVYVKVRCQKMFRPKLLEKLYSTWSPFSDNKII